MNRHFRSSTPKGQYPSPVFCNNYRFFSLLWSTFSVRHFQNIYLVIILALCGPSQQTENTVAVSLNGGRIRFDQAKQNL